MATIKDIAKEAGVSIGTVSAVLNGHTTIKPENIIKVNNAVKKFDYQINMAARTLKTGASNSIGLLIPDISNPIYPELARGVEDAVRLAGFTVFLCNNDQDIQKEKEYIKALIAKSVDGIIIVKPQMSKEELTQVEKQCRIVLIDTTPELSQTFDVVNLDDRGGITSAMKLLIKYGHRKIAFICGQIELNNAILRFDAYKQVLSENNLIFETDYFKQRQYNWFSGYSATIELLRLPNIPTAILAANDIIAIGSLKALSESKLSEAKDISVIGFDDIDQASYSCPPLTTVKQPKYEMGAASVEMLLKKKSMARIGERKNMVKVFDTEIILRETVKHVNNSTN